MDYILGKRLYSDSTLKTLHTQYLNCVNQSIRKAFEAQQVGNEEYCLNEKTNYYNYLHDKNKIEHDNILRYFESIRRLEN